jgi:dTDP-glucose 4,6-dehydratase
MKILVTGSEGTLGTPLVKELKARGNNVWGCDLAHSKKDNYVRCDISNYRQIRDLLEKEKFDFVYHLAAEFGRMNGEHYYEQVWQSNVIGTRNILECQKDLPFRLIFASSSEIYGDLKADYLKEDMMPEPQQNDYAISKWVNELQCKNFRARHGNKIMVLRFFNAYGPGEYYNDYRSVISLFCYRALHDIPYEVYEGYHRVFMYIDDFIPTLANAHDQFEDGETINIGGKEYREVKDLSDIILNALGKDDKLVTYLPTDKHNVVNKRPDIDKARRVLMHNPTTKLEEGVIETIAWMKMTYGLVYP